MSTAPLLQPPCLEISPTSIDQASELRAAMRANRVGDLAAATQVMAPHPRSNARVLAVASGKGGVGKSHVSLNLSILLGRLGRRALLIDMDLGTANVDVMLNFQPALTLADFLAGRCSAGDVLHQLNPSVQFIAGPSGESRHAENLLSEPHRVRRLLDQVGAWPDLVVLDCGAGVGPVVRSVMSEADAMLLVTTPDPAAMADAYALLKVTHRTLAIRNVPALLVVNQVTNERQFHWVADRIASVARRFLAFEIQPAGFVRSDQHVPEAGRRRQPWAEVFPRCRAAQDLSVLAGWLDGQLPVRAAPGSIAINV